MTPPIGSTSANQVKPLVKIPASNGFDLDMKTMKPIDGRPGSYTVSDTKGKDYIVNASGTVQNSTIQGPNYSQTANNSSGINVGVSIFNGKDIDKNGIPDDSTEIFGGNFSYNGTTEKLSQDSNDDPKTTATKDITSYILNNNEHLAGFNSYTAEVPANKRGEKEIHTSTETNTVAQAPAERDSMENIMLSGEQIAQRSQIFKLPVREQ